MTGAPSARRGSGRTAPWPARPRGTAQYRRQSWRWRSWRPRRRPCGRSGRSAAIGWWISRAGMMLHDVLVVHCVYLDSEQFTNPSRYPESGRQRRQRRRRHDDSKLCVADLTGRHTTKQLPVHRVDVQAHGRGLALRLRVHGLGPTDGTHITELDLALDVPAVALQPRAEGIDDSDLITTHPGTLPGRHPRDVGMGPRRATTPNLRRPERSRHSPARRRTVREPGRLRRRGRRLKRAPRRVELGEDPYG